MASKLVRPTNALGTGIFSTGNNPFSGTEGTDFAVKVFEYQGQFSVPVVEVTGGGDTAPTYTNGGLVYGQFRLVGAMISGDAVGVAELKDQINAHGNSDIKMQLDFGDSANGHGLKKVMLDSIQISASVRQSAIVGVTISGRYTEDAIEG